MCPRPMPNCGSECNKRIENLKQLGTCLDRRTWKAKRVDDWQRRRWPPPSPPQQQEQQQQRTHTHKPGLTQAPLTAQSLSHMPSARLPPWKNDQIYKKKSKINNTKIELFLGVRFQTVSKQWNRSITESCGDAKLELFSGALLQADTT